MSVYVHNKSIFFYVHGRDDANADLQFLYFISRVRNSDHIEFVVKVIPFPSLFKLPLSSHTSIYPPKQAGEDLVHEGNLKSISRVRCGSSYTCIMTKNQRFSSLFRHYAKHHGLKKDELEYTFVDVLNPEDSPESVYLLSMDEVVVRMKKCKAKEGPFKFNSEMVAPTKKFVMDFERLMEDCEKEGDVKLLVGSSKIPIMSHRAVLVARSAYFRSMLRRDGMLEGSTNVVTMADQSESTIRRMLQFMYCNRIPDIISCHIDELVELLSMADEFCMDSLKTLCEYTACARLSPSTVAKLLLAGESYNAPILTRGCMKYIEKHLDVVVKDTQFELQLKETSWLGYKILLHMAEDQIGDSNRNHVVRNLKRKRAAAAPVTAIDVHSEDEVDCISNGTDNRSTLNTA